MVAYYLHDLSPHLVRFTDSIAIHWYGLAYVLGFYLCYLVMHFLSVRGLSVLKPEQVGDFITSVALFGVVLGGRLGYMLLYDFQHFIHEPWSFLKINNGGMASHGGVAGVALVCLWYARKHSVSWTGLGDALVCGAPLGLFLGRIANFINGELFGRVTTVAWAVKFPTELQHEDYLAQGGTFVPVPPELQHSPEIIAWFEQNGGGRQELETILHPRHPSQIYEALGEGLLMFLMLFFIRLRYRNLPEGLLTAIFFLAYAAVRFSLENVRQPDSGAEMIMGLTPGQFFTLFMVIAGLGFLAHAMLRGRKKQAEA